jgi:hypothetical protein
VYKVPSDPLLIKSSVPDISKQSRNLHFRSPGKFRLSLSWNFKHFVWVEELEFWQAFASIDPLCIGLFKFSPSDNNFACNYRLPTHTLKIYFGKAVPYEELLVKWPFGMPSSFQTHPITHCQLCAFRVIYCVTPCLYILT